LTLDQAAEFLEAGVIQVNPLEKPPAEGRSVHVGRHVWSDGDSDLPQLVGHRIRVQQFPGRGLASPSRGADKGQRQPNP
jgi:Ni/Co efflux regulator RcnB